MNEEEMDYGGYNPDDAIIHWLPWKKKFAIFPTKVLHQWVWFGSYYERSGHNLYTSHTQLGTLLDVLKATD
jgi:hypothetical protein